MFYSVKIKPLLVSIIVPLLVGLLSGSLSRSGTAAFQTINKPPLSPPAIVFPIVWTILFILMGIALYLVYDSDVSESKKKEAYSIFILQLIVNFFWPLIFFNLGAYWFAFIWLVILWILILRTIITFKEININAAYLLIPYLLWVTFAGYLNLGIALLN